MIRLGWSGRSGCQALPEECDNFVPGCKRGLRVDKPMELLETTRMGFDEIAEKVG